jgi:predicted ATPase with chaperone activity
MLRGDLKLVAPTNKLSTTFVLGLICAKYATMLNGDSDLKGNTNDCVTTLTIVGLPNTAVQEARERVRSAIRNSGCVFPMKRVVVNLASAEVREFCHVEDSAQSLLKAAMKQFYLSARAFHRILKLARTIADIEGADIIKAHHLAETIQYRPRSQI